MEFPVLTRFEGLDYRRHLLTLASFNLPIVDVGSGDARTSHWLQQQQSNEVSPATIYCVDPAPESYVGLEGRQVMIKPVAATTQEIVETHPELIGECAMMLIRPQPPSPGRVCYDMDAWRLLKPKVVLVLYCADGGDGSPELHSWLNMNGCPSFSLSDAAVDVGALPNYYSRSVKFTAEYPPPSMVRVSTCSLLIQADVDGLVFPPDMPEDEQNPGAPSDAEVENLLQQSLMATMARVLGGGREGGGGGAGQECALQ
jgi:hypothetical protein